MSNRAAFLQSTKLFQNVEPERLKEIGDTMQETVLEAGAAVFEEVDHQQIC